MVEGLIILGMIAGFEILAARFGRSSRDGEDWTERYGPHMTIAS